MLWRGNISVGGRRGPSRRMGRAKRIILASRLLENLPSMSTTSVQIEERGKLHIVRLKSDDGTNRLTRDCVLSLAEAVNRLAREHRPIVFAGNDRLFSAGADLAEISALDGPSAFEFSKM